MTDVIEGRAQLAAWDRRPERFPVDLASRVLGAIPDGLDFVLLDLPPSAGAIVRGTLAVLRGGAVLAPVQLVAQTSPAAEDFHAR